MDPSYTGFSSRPQLSWKEWLLNQLKNREARATLGKIVLDFTAFGMSIYFSRNYGQALAV